MSVVGIVAEFNPFHMGHEYIINEAKRLTGADKVIAVMSGDYVQRGEPAVCDKYLRTEMALKAGVDLVLELPVVYATANAGRFAEGAVRTLVACGVVDYICFGSESGDIDLINSVAELLIDEPGEYKLVLQNNLKKGLSYPEARELALVDYFTNNLSKQIDSETIKGLVSSPNNILGIEYCCALKRLEKEESGLHLPKALAIKRLGAGYLDTTIKENQFSSASGIRKLLEEGDAGLSKVDTGCPQYSATIIKDNYGKRLPVAADDFSQVLYYRINTMSLEELKKVDGISPDLADRINKFKEQPFSFTELASQVKTKNITYSSVSRALLHIILGCNSIIAGDRELESEKHVPYLRLLGVRKESSGLVKSIKELYTGEVITKLADSHNRDNPMYRIDVFAGELYREIIKMKYGILVPGEYQHGVLIF